MSEYIPDKWVCVKITTDKTAIYKVFASWYGGWAGADSWQMNSGIRKIEEDGQCYLFHGYSGSVYRCHKAAYGQSAYGAGVLSNLMKRMKEAGSECEILDDDMNFMEIVYDDERQTT